MKKTTSHHHLNIGNKKVLCAVEYEKDLRQYDVTLWCDNRIIGRERIKTISKAAFTRLASHKLKTLQATERQKTVKV